MGDGVRVGEEQEGSKEDEGVGEEVEELKKSGDIEVLVGWRVTRSNRTLRRFFIEGSEESDMSDREDEEEEQGEEEQGEEEEEEEKAGDEMDTGTELEGLEDEEDNEMDTEGE